MKKYLILIFFILLFSTNTFAYLITHPDAQEMTVIEDGIFFTGKIDKHEKIFIDGIQMLPNKSKAFCYNRKLNIGENIFAVQIHDSKNNIITKKYTITRIPEEKISQKQLIEENLKYNTTKRDGVVLRSTPINKGMNRLGYLPQNTKLIIDGHQNIYSRVYLKENEHAWILTQDITPIEEIFNYIPIDIISTQKTENKNSQTFKISLSDNCPYKAITYKNKLILTLYNINNQSETYQKEFSLEKFQRYSIEENNNEIIINILKNPIEDNYSNKNIKIIIDAGHGGKETGAVGCLGHKEKDFNLNVALKLEKLLNTHKFNVYLTRKTDTDLSLNDRIKFAKDKDALIFISIHMNSIPISDNPVLNEGSVVFYYNENSKDLAMTLAKYLSKDLKTKNGGATQASFAVIRPTEYIGVLAELAYLVNPNDTNIYTKKCFRTKAARSIYNGLIEYLHTETLK